MCAVYSLLGVVDTNGSVANLPGAIPSEKYWLSLPY